jgi:hypothetical protein
MNQGETEMMMRRLGTAQDQLPLVLEIAQLEQQILRDGLTPESPASEKQMVKEI